MKRILIVEDDMALAQELQYLLISISMMRSASKNSPM